MLNNINRAIQNTLSQDINDLSPIDKIAMENALIAKYPTLDNTHYFLSSGRWHSTSLYTLLIDNIRPVMPGWTNSYIITGTDKYIAQIPETRIKIASSLRRGQNNNCSNYYEGRLKIEISKDSAPDESLIENITQRIYYYLFNHNNMYCSNDIICIHDPCNGILNCTLRFLEIEGNYDRRILSYDIVSLETPDAIII